MTDTIPTIRTFDTGATRDSDAGKLEFAGFLSPEVLTAFAKYMHKHRTMKDGSLRASDNWKNGMPKRVYLESLLRHVIDLWLYEELGVIPDRPEGETPELADTLGGIFFNLQGLWLQYLHDDLDDTGFAW